MLLRFLFYKARTYNINPTRVGSALDDFNSFAIFENDCSGTTLDISNPFPDKESELKDYLKNHHENIFESINNFGSEVEKIKISLKEFKFKLKFIVDNKVDELKGECDFEKGLL